MHTHVHACIGSTQEDLQGQNIALVFQIAPHPFSQWKSNPFLGQFGNSVPHMRSPHPSGSSGVSQKMEENKIQPIIIIQSHQMYTHTSTAGTHGSRWEFS